MPFCFLYSLSCWASGVVKSCQVYANWISSIESHGEDNEWTCSVDFGCATSYKQWAEAALQVQKILKVWNSNLSNRISCIKDRIGASKSFRKTGSTPTTVTTASTKCLHGKASNPSLPGQGTMPVPSPTITIGVVSFSGNWNVPQTTAQATCSSDCTWEANSYNHAYIVEHTEYVYVHKYVHIIYYKKYMYILYSMYYMYICI